MAMTPPAYLEMWLAAGSFAEATPRGLIVTSGPYGARTALAFPAAVPYVERAAILAQFAAVVEGERDRYLTLDAASQTPAPPPGGEP